MERLKIAIQKNGRLSEKSLQLLREAGIKLTNGTRKLVSVSGNYPIEVLYLRDDDIPNCIMDGAADVGIVGENVLKEKSVNLNIYQRLGFASCRMSLAIPKSEEFSSISYFNGKRIATSYPQILSGFLDNNSIDAEIHEISGSVEISTGIGIADAIFDIVSSGSTLISNGLKEVVKVMDSEAVLVGREDLSAKSNEILFDLQFRIKSVLEAKFNRYILLNAPKKKLDKIVEVIPGMKSPTILPLAQEGWVSIHSVINEEKFWEVIDKLKKLGAQGILVIPIEKMIV